MKENRTKIIATIGPACAEKSVLLKMMQAGMDAARLNFSHGNYNAFSRMIKNMREISKLAGREIAVIQDLQGPKIRLGKIKDIELQLGQKVTLGRSGLPIQFRPLPKYLKKGNRIFIDDGGIELAVLSVDKRKENIFCITKTPGVLKSFRGINVPTAHIRTPPVTEKDLEDLKFGLKHDVDYVALSFVEKAADILNLKRFLKREKSHAKVIAKIERKEAIKNLEEIIKAADCVMVARGDLGIETPPEMVPLYQKKIIHLSKLYAKPVIVATQMLSSMVENPQPTRAEISDAAFAIFEYADALMLSNETSVGKYPVKAVETLSRVATAVERELSKYPHLQFTNEKALTDLSLTNATCLSAAKLAQDIKAKYIVAITKTGYTAREIAKHRPFIPLIVFTPDAKTARQLSIVWDVKKVFVKKVALQNPLPLIKKILALAELVKTDDGIVICNAGFNQKEKFLTSAIIKS